MAGADSPRHKIDGRHDDQGHGAFLKKRNRQERPGRQELLDPFPGAPGVLGGFFSLTILPLRPLAFLWMHKIQASKEGKLKYPLLEELFWKISVSCFPGHAHARDATGLAFRFESELRALSSRCGLD